MKKIVEEIDEDGLFLSFGFFAGAVAGFSFWVNVQFLPLIISLLSGIFIGIKQSAWELRHIRHLIIRRERLFSAVGIFLFIFFVIVSGPAVILCGAIFFLSSWVSLVVSNKIRGRKKK